MYRLLPVLLLAAVPAFGQSAPAPLPAPLADTLVVTATRTPDDARRTGRAVTVVTAEEIAQMPATSLDEVLRTAAGVEVHARGPLGAQADFTIRGSTFGGVLLLIDGVRADDPQTGHFLSDFPIPLAEIARIEVLRGPAAALYGPDAVGGVVHVITRTADGTPASRLGARVGAYDLRETEVATAAPFGPVRFGLAAHTLRTTGEPVESLDGGTMGDRARGDLDRQAYTAALRGRVLGGDVLVRGAVDDRRYGSVRHYTASRLDTAFSTAHTTWAQGSYRRVLSPRLSVDAAVGWRRHESTYTFNRATPANAHDNRQTSAVVAARYAVGPGLGVDVGATAMRRTIESNNMGDRAAVAVGAFAQARFASGPLSGALAARVDRDAEGFGTEVTPQASLAYTARRVGLRAAAGRAVRAPSFTDLYYNTQVLRIRGRDVGNPALTAERAWSAEAGVDVYPAAGLTLRATGFWRTTDGLIDFVKVSAADTVFRAQNLLSVDAQGVEAEASYVRGGGRLRLAYTYLDLTRDASAVAVSKYALLNAEHLVQVSGAYTVRRGPAQGLRASANAFWRDPYDNPPAPAGVVTARTERPYAVVDVQAAYPLPLRRYALTLTAEVRNVFDTRYVELFAPVMGRWWILGVRVGG